MPQYFWANKLFSSLTVLVLSTQNSAVGKRLRAGDSINFSNGLTANVVFNYSRTGFMRVSIQIKPVHIGHYCFGDLPYMVLILVYIAG